MAPGYNPGGGSLKLLVYFSKIKSKKQLEANFKKVIRFQSQTQTGTGEVG